MTSGRDPDADHPRLSAARTALAANASAPFAHHNLAAALADLDRNAEAETAARRAFALGGDAPETWLVLGRALQGQNRFDEAMAAYRAAVGRRPNYADALKDIGQLIWMRTGDASRAVADIDAAIRAHAGQPLLRVVKAQLLDYAGDPRAGYAALVSGLMDPVADLTAAQLAETFDPELALRHAQRAAQGGRHTAAPVRLMLAQCLIALTRPDEALEQLAHLRAATPDDQYVIALQATAWRQQGDPRWAELYDYGAFVRPATIDTPEGWPDLPTYLADLKVALLGLHRLKTHPLGQSLRGGSQTTAALKRSDDPVIRAFFQAIDGPIRRCMAALGQGADPLRSRNTGAYDIAGSWSVRLRPNGFHADHVHPKGWLSSACYIDLPPAVDGDDREGWIKFGEPAVRSEPRLGPEHFVKPAPGTLVLFPSYMWHGTVPFGGEADRLTVAFDVIPA